MYRPKNTQERILHRLKIARGHLEGVTRMINDDAYCIDVIHQSQAIQKGLKQVDNLILQNHLENCVVDKIKKGQTKEAIKEIMDVFKKGY